MTNEPITSDNLVSEPPSKLIMERYASLDKIDKNHAGHAFNTEVLLKIEKQLPETINYSAETGCGKSTILFSNYSKMHYVFALDDRNDEDNSSFLFYHQNPLTKNKNIRTIFGPTQKTLPLFSFREQLDVVLIDGPHGFPFPDLEYYYFYPQIRTGGLLIVDDVNIPTIGRLADVIAEDEMFELVTIISTTALFRRTDAAVFDPTGDGWWTQVYNRRRVSPKRDIFLPSERATDRVSSLRLDRKLHGDEP